MSFRFATPLILGVIAAVLPVTAAEVIVPELRNEATPTTSARGLLVPHSYPWA